MQPFLAGLGIVGRLRFDSLEKEANGSIAHCDKHLTIRRNGGVVHSEWKIQYGEFYVLGQRVESHCLVVVGEDSNHVFLRTAIGWELVYGDGVDNVLSNLLETHTGAGAEDWGRSRHPGVKRQ